MKRNFKMFMLAVLMISMLALLISCGGQSESEGEDEESIVEVEEETLNIDVNCTVDKLLRTVNYSRLHLNAVHLKIVPCLSSSGL